MSDTTGEIHRLQQTVKALELRLQAGIMRCESLLMYAYAADHMSMKDRGIVQAANEIKKVLEEETDGKNDES
jgi:hypothetical protein